MKNWVCRWRQSAVQAQHVAVACIFGVVICLTAGVSRAEPLRLTITDGVIEPLPFAIGVFEAEDGGAQPYAENVGRTVAADLAGTGLFRQIPSSAFIGKLERFEQTVSFVDWRAINAQALITGSVSSQGDQLIVKFRLYDVFSGQELGAGQQLVGRQKGWRRIAHKISDVVYGRITGEGGYFDSRVVFVGESGAKGNRRKQLAIMDYDGQNVQFLTDNASLVLAPRFSPTGTQVLYTSYESGFPRINVLDVASTGRRQLTTAAGEMAFSPRFSPSGGQVIYSLANGGNTDIWRTDLNSGGHQRLTQAPSIETAPSFSPDGRQIVFESDRSGSQQLYIMPSSGGSAKRISFGSGRYGTPVWSPRGDLIAFTKQSGGRFHIGVMRIDGSEERLLTASQLDEGPSWSPNGRELMFMRETLGVNGTSSLYSVDIGGRNLKKVQVPSFAGASDPSWGPLQK